MKTAIAKTVVSLLALTWMLLALAVIFPQTAIAQLNRISPAQITCAAGRILAGGTPTTCTANPILDAAGSLSWGSSGATSPDIFLRRTAAKTLKIDADAAAGPLTLLDINASEIDLGVPNGGLVKLSGAGVLAFNTRSRLITAADKALQILDSGQATGLEINGGTPTLGTCTGGSMTSGSHNGAGEVTGNTSGSCAINFGTPNFTNAPFCTLNDETNLVAARISARSASSITITGLTSGDAAQWICIGPIGT